MDDVILSLPYGLDDYNKENLSGREPMHRLSTAQLCCSDLDDEGVFPAASCD